MHLINVLLISFAIRAEAISSDVTYRALKDLFSSCTSSITELIPSPVTGLLHLQNGGSAVEKYERYVSKYLYSPHPTLLEDI